jgi:hypothetical protein
MFLADIPRVGMDSIQTMAYGLVAFEDYLGISEIPIEIPMPEPIEIPLPISRTITTITSIRRDHSFVRGATEFRRFV